ncbi:type VII secretion protein EccCa [Streptomyces benahoarensis]|uniref:Type VII secretion protein EccCa n=1 Tax=Streptomyces benahoarensis TaxID=2595054 RepID=A0A553ZQT5_9ACTN|nr:type VII secretion protein EccCa [Streptomyces benahoarensis]TSB20590.1 type VII secretion protein EccCa [Streptomyces benahoarensis]TSB43838.1 type VII secretion protein EccCa [Streptomyces benahoarensis]
MSTVTFRRPPRRPGPQLPSGELSLQEPPTLPEAQGGLSGVITYLPMALSSMGMMLIFMRPGSGGALSYVAIGMMALSAVGMLATQFLRSSQDRKRKLRGERRDYLRYLSTSRRRVRKVITQQRQALSWQHPEPPALWSLARTSRLWERRLTHEDFAEVRIARGSQQLALKLSPLSTKPVEDLEPLCAHALRRFIRAYGTVPDQPVAVRLRTYSRIVFDGDEEVARATVRGVLAQLAVLHAPRDLDIVVVADGEARTTWEWVKWLPHAQHSAETDGAGAARLVTDTISELEALLGEEFAQRPKFGPDNEPSRDEPYTVIVLDTSNVPQGARVAGPGYSNAVIMDVRGALGQKPSRHALRLRIADGELRMLGTDRNGKETESAIGRPEVMGIAAARALAATVASYRPGVTAQSEAPLEQDMDLAGLLGITDLRAAPLDRLMTRSRSERLRVPIGLSADGSPVELDIKESAQGGMGPHGMLIGATGSGKSELLRTLVLSLALTHSSETLNFVLVDFKGGATFLGLDELPHTSAVITNLADETALVERMKDALHGEMIRRQELLRKAGNYSSALEYERAREGGAALEPLPTLFVVVDEFSELLAAHRDFMELFVMIGRLGRSLGVHLLLASQRLDEGRMHQLESHLSYRVGLRTFSAMESRGVLGVPDAYNLPSQPGSGLLKNDVGTLTRFKAAYVSGPYRAARRAAQQAVIAGQVVPFGTTWVAQRQMSQASPEPLSEEADENAPSLLSIAADRLRAYPSRPAHQVWLPPLEAPPTLDLLLPPLAPVPGRGLSPAEEPGARLTVPVGIVDRPFDQRRDPLMADLSGSGGHVGIAGGPQSGKSNLVRTLITALALTHTPREVQFYCLDFGGGSLSGLSRLPHVGGVTGRLDPERVVRTMAEVTGVIARRERQFAELGIESMDDFRRRRAAGELPDERFGDVFLVVDGWSTVRQDFMDLVPTFNLISSRGLSFGVHLIIASTRWGEISSGLRDQLGTRFELRLGDPVDSVINMRAADTVPKIPGRGMTQERLHFLTALPRLDGEPQSGTVSEGVTAMVNSVRDAWDGPPAPPVRMLPLELDAATLPAAEGDLRVPLGLEDQRLEPLWHDFEANPHLIVIGDAETGKTNLLKLICQAVTDRYTPDQGRMMLVDFRRTLASGVPESHRLGYAVATDKLRQMIEGVARAMRERVPGPDIAPERLSKRDWWTGPQLFVVVDDFEMVGGGGMGPSPFAPLLEFLPQGNELGLHLVVARSANGASRGISDQLLRQLLECNTPALMLSCPPSEGMFLPGVKPRQMTTGRGLYVTRRGTTQVQTAMLGAASQA